MGEELVYKEALGPWGGYSENRCPVGLDVRLLILQNCEKFFLFTHYLVYAVLLQQPDESHVCILQETEQQATTAGSVCRALSFCSMEGALQEAVQQCRGFQRVWLLCSAWALSVPGSKDVASKKHIQEENGLSVSLAFFNHNHPFQMSGGEGAVNSPWHVEARLGFYSDWRRNQTLSDGKFSGAV